MVLCRTTNACPLSIASGDHWQLPPPYNKWSDETAYRCLFPRLHHWSRQHLRRLPFHLWSNMAVASSFQFSPYIHRRVIPPYLGPPSDIMLTSFTKKVPKSHFLHIFAQNHYFLVFLLVNCKISLKLHYVFCMSDCKFNPLSCCQHKFINSQASSASPLPGIYHFSPVYPGLLNCLH